MYGVVMHDYMMDYLSKEFIVVYGNTKAEAITNAWKQLKKDMGDDIRELQLDCDDSDVTKKLFTKMILDNEDSDDGLYFPYPFNLYVKLFEIDLRKRGKAYDNQDVKGNDQGFTGQ